MAGLTKNQLAGMVKDLRGQYTELAGAHIDLQKKYLGLQIDYNQSLGKRLNTLEKLAGKRKANLPKQKESLVFTPELNGKEGGANHGV